MPCCPHPCDGLDDLGLRWIVDGCCPGIGWVRLLGAGRDGFCPAGRDGCLDGRHCCSLNFHRSKMRIDAVDAVAGADGSAWATSLGDEQRLLADGAGRL
ncbi:hypothetical protein ACLOJK_004897 [Asimina triloba]